MERKDEFVRLDDREQTRIWWPERVAAHAGERLSPDAVLGEVEGLAIILETVTRGEADLAIGLRCQRNARTAALDEAYASAWASWEALAGSEHPASTPPEMPGGFMMNIPVVVTDDLGTRYTLHGRRGPNTGSEWKAAMRFYSPVPAEARTLTVSLAAAAATPNRSSSRCRR